MQKYRAELQAFINGLYPSEQKVLVFGEGPLRPKLMLIGEAPGEQETLQQRPFVGKAGANLNMMLNVCALQRDAIYIGNAVKFRPVKTGASGREINRPPTAEEIAIFRPWLLREIEIVCPRLIATLGNVPLKSLSGRAISIGNTHGRVIELNGRLVYPMYHPASMIYNPKLGDVFEDDLRVLAGIVGGFE